MLLALVRALAVVSTGLAAGVFLGHWRGVSVAMPALDPGSFVQLQQVIHVQFVPMMPILLFVAAGTSVAWMLLLRARWRDAPFKLVAAAAVITSGVLVLTLTVNVPINGLLMTWDAAAPPSDLDTLWRPWEVAHAIRTPLQALAFVLQVLAMAPTSRSRTP